MSSGLVAKACPLCGRERERIDTFITGACVKQEECERFIRDQRDRLREALRREMGGGHASACGCRTCVDLREGKL